MFDSYTQNRYGSNYSVDFPDFPSLTVTPQNITLYQEVGMQDVVELTYPRFSSFYHKALKTGVPVSIKMANDKVSSNWFGYVYDIKTNTNQSLGQPIIVRCVASSLSLKDGGSKIWLNKTASDIVVDIAKKFGLKPIVTPHNTIFSQQSLTGHTYWEKIQELAVKIGYAAHLMGTELHFHPLDNMIDRFMTTMPTMAYLDPAAEPYSGLRDQTLDVFRTTTGDYSDSEQSSRTEKNVYGVDPLTAKFYKVTSSADTVGKNLREDVVAPLFKEIVSTAISGSQEMAQVLADGYAQFSRFIHHATGAAQGDPRLSPYRTMEVINVGENIDGYWVVKKATHFLTYDGRYEVEFSCMKDGRGANKSSATRPSTAGKVPVRNLTLELSNGNSSSPTYTSLNGQDPLYNQNNAGFAMTSRKWVGK